MNRRWGVEGCLCVYMSEIWLHDIGNNLGTRSIHSQVSISSSANRVMNE